MMDQDPSKSPSQKRQTLPDTNQDLVKEVNNENVANNNEVEKETIANEEVENEQVAELEVDNEQVADVELEQDQVADESIKNEQAANEEVKNEENAIEVEDIDKVVSKQDEDVKEPDDNAQTTAVRSSETRNTRSTDVSQSPSIRKSLSTSLGLEDDLLEDLGPPEEQEEGEPDELSAQISLSELDFTDEELLWVLLENHANELLLFMNDEECPLSQEVLSILQEYSESTETEIEAVDISEISTLIPDFGEALNMFTENDPPVLFNRQNYVGNYIDVVSANRFHRLDLVVEPPSCPYYHIVIVGSGPGALSVVKEIERSGKGLKIALVDWTAIVPYDYRRVIGMEPQGKLPRSMLWNAIRNVLATKDARHLLRDKGLSLCGDLSDVWSEAMSTIAKDISQANWNFRKRLAVAKIEYYRGSIEFIGTDILTVTSCKEGIDSCTSSETCSSSSSSEKKCSCKSCLCCRRSKKKSIVSSSTSSTSTSTTTSSYDSYEDKIQRTNIVGMNFIICGGSLPRISEFPGFELCTTIDNFLYERNIPTTALIIGNTPEVFETAYLIGSYGGEVTVMNKSSTWLPNYDQECMEKVISSFKDLGVKFFKISRIFFIKELKSGYKVRVKLENGKHYTRTYLTVIMDYTRKPISYEINIEEAGVEIDPLTRKIIVNGEYRTKNPGIWAFGSVVRKHLGTPHFEMLAGRRVIKLILDGFDDVPLPKVFPRVLLAPLEYGFVGETEKSAKLKYKSKITVYDYESRLVSYKQTSAGNKLNFEPPFQIKIICYGHWHCFHNKTVERVIGIHFLGKNAARLITGFAPSLEKGITKREFVEQVAIKGSAELGLFKTELKLKNAPKKILTSPSTEDIKKNEYIKVNVPYRCTEEPPYTLSRVRQHKEISNVTLKPRRNVPIKSPATNIWAAEWADPSSIGVTASKTNISVINMISRSTGVASSTDVSTVSTLSALSYTNVHYSSLQYTSSTSLAEIDPIDVISATSTAEPEVNQKPDAKKTINASLLASTWVDELSDSNSTIRSPRTSLPDISAIGVTTEKPTTKASSTGVISATSTADPEVNQKPDAKKPINASLLASIWELSDSNITVISSGTSLPDISAIGVTTEKSRTKASGTGIIIPTSTADPKANQKPDANKRINVPLLASTWVDELSDSNSTIICTRTSLPDISAIRVTNQKSMTKASSTGILSETSTADLDINQKPDAKKPLKASLLASFWADESSDSNSKLTPSEKSLPKISAIHITSKTSTTKTSSMGIISETSTADLDINQRPDAKKPLKASLLARFWADEWSDSNSTIISTRTSLPDISAIGATTKRSTTKGSSTGIISTTSTADPKANQKPDAKKPINVSLLANTWVNELSDSNSTIISPRTSLPDISAIGVTTEKPTTKASSTGIITATSTADPEVNQKPDAKTPINPLLLASTLVDELSHSNSTIKSTRTSLPDISAIGATTKKFTTKTSSTGVISATSTADPDVNKKPDANKPIRPTLLIGIWDVELSDSSPTVTPSEKSLPDIRKIGVTSKTSTIKTSCTGIISATSSAGPDVIRKPHANKPLKASPMTSVWEWSYSKSAAISTQNSLPDISEIGVTTEKSTTKASGTGIISATATADPEVNRKPDAKKPINASLLASTWVDKLSDSNSTILSTRTSLPDISAIRVTTQKSVTTASRTGILSETPTADPEVNQKPDANKPLKVSLLARFWADELSDSNSKLTPSEKSLPDISTIHITSKTSTTKTSSTGIISATTIADPEVNQKPDANKPLKVSLLARFWADELSDSNSKLTPSEKSLPDTSTIHITSKTSTTKTSSLGITSETSTADLDINQKPDAKKPLKASLLASFWADESSDSNSKLTPSEKSLPDTSTISITSKTSTTKTSSLVITSETSTADLDINQKPDAKKPLKASLLARFWADESSDSNSKLTPSEKSLPDTSTISITSKTSTTKTSSLGITSETSTADLDINQKPDAKKPLKASLLACFWADESSDSNSKLNPSEKSLPDISTIHITSKTSKTKTSSIGIISETSTADLDINQRPDAKKPLKASLLASFWADESSDSNSKLTPSEKSLPDISAIHITSKTSTTKTSSMGIISETSTADIDINQRPDAKKPLKASLLASFWADEFSDSNSKLTPSEKSLADISTIRITSKTSTTKTSSTGIISATTIADPEVNKKPDANKPLKASLLARFWADESSDLSSTVKISGKSLPDISTVGVTSETSTTKTSSTGIMSATTIADPGVNQKPDANKPLKASLLARFWAAELCDSSSTDKISGKSLPDTSRSGVTSKTSKTKTSSTSIISATSTADPDINHKPDANKPIKLSPMTSFWAVESDDESSTHTGEDTSMADTCTSGITTGTSSTESLYVELHSSSSGSSLNSVDREPSYTTIYTSYTHASELCESFTSEESSETDVDTDITPIKPDANTSINPFLAGLDEESRGENQLDGCRTPPKTEKKMDQTSQIVRDFRLKLIMLLLPFILAEALAYNDEVYTSVAEPDSEGEASVSYLAAKDDSENKFSSDSSESSDDDDNENCNLQV